MPNLASKSTCTGCMACVDKCPHHAIFINRGNDGHRYVSIDYNICVECKLCEKTCPVVNEFIYGENNLGSDFFAGWSNDSTYRKNGATSGIFGTLARTFIENGGWVAGAVMDGLECKYILTNSVNDIDKLQGSKYTTSNPVGIYKQILERLKLQEPILFSGLPCHVAALLSYVPIKLQQDLFTIDLICGGVSSSLLIEKFADNIQNLDSIISFRNKINGWKPNGFKYSLTYETEDGVIHTESSNQRNLVTDGFACELTDRMSCYDCNFSKTHRKSDLTIGDLWKDDMFTNEHFNGVSSLIVHSPKGKKILDQSPVMINKIAARQVLIPNSRIFNGKSIKKIFPERKLIGLLFKYLSYKSLLRIYGSDLKTSNIVWWPFAVYRVMSFRIAQAFRERSNKRILAKLFK